MSARQREVRERPNDFLGLGGPGLRGFFLAATALNEIARRVAAAGWTGGQEEERRFGD